MSAIHSVVSTIPQVTPGTAGQLASPMAAEAAQPQQPPPAVEISARLRAGGETVNQVTEAAGRLADAAPAAVGRFATTRRIAPPAERGNRSESGTDSRDKDSLLELFAGARPDAGQGVGRLSGALGRSKGGPVGRFAERPPIQPRPRRSSVDQSALQKAFSNGVGRSTPTVGRLSGALQR